MKKIFLTILGLLAVIAVLGGAKTMQIKDLIDAGAAMTMPASVVSTTKVQRFEWEDSLNSIGSLEAAQGVTITADIPGRITHIEFQSGQNVNVGDVLVQQDISSELAQLRAAEASVTLAKVNLKRTTELLKKKVSSKSSFDQADALYKQAVAQADTIRTSINKKTIRAPFSGRLGIRSVNIGQDLGQSDAIVSLQAVDPILVNFYLPQQNLHKLKMGLLVRVKTDAAPKHIFRGSITAISPEVDPSTRNVKVQASLSNMKQTLLPGMFANVEVVLPQKTQVLAVPITAINYATFGDSVYVVVEKTDEETGETQLIAQQQFVQLGAALGDFVSIIKGVEAGADVVSAGAFKLHNGSAVQINNDTQAEYSLTPNPKDS